MQHQPLPIQSCHVALQSGLCWKCFQSMRRQGSFALLLDWLSVAFKLIIALWATLCIAWIAHTTMQPLPNPAVLCQTEIAIHVFQPHKKGKTVLTFPFLDKTDCFQIMYNWLPIKLSYGLPPPLLTVGNPQIERDACSLHAATSLPGVTYIVRILLYKVIDW